MRKIWLFSGKTDLLLLGLPVWICWCICFLLPQQILNQELPVWSWVILVIGIDVSHVWSTLFRTYLDKDEFLNHNRLLKIAPLVSFGICLIIALISIQLFWTCLAYLALYHFIKQQYGFMRLYQAKYGRMDFKKMIPDSWIIYLAMVYPVLYWHLNDDRQFEWFVPGDFFALNIDVLQSGLPLFNTISPWIYFLLIGAWLFEEIWAHTKVNSKLPIGKWIWVLTTAGNWYLGIVYFNSDVAFTMTNIVAHGIPYFVLIFVYTRKKNDISSSNRMSKNWPKYAMLMIGLLAFLAFGEEYLWDMFLYHDNPDLFQSIINYPFDLLQSPVSQAIALAALSLPQVTHYVLDGFIWKVNEFNPFVKKVLLS